MLTDVAYLDSHEAGFFLVEDTNNCNSKCISASDDNIECKNDEHNSICSIIVGLKYIMNCAINIH